MQKNLRRETARRESWNQQTDAQTDNAAKLTIAERAFSIGREMMKRVVSGSNNCRD